ncbi:hypothetical protein BaRGS_00038973 [Batillaria attramentaria]|uniref:Uncharacterized protein n=1 Tax=Batillaria attramentaria TaxID=370345 RepID=A0ABD0J4K2_9CAEN
MERVSEGQQAVSQISRTSTNIYATPLSSRQVSATSQRVKLQAGQPTLGLTSHRCLLAERAIRPAHCQSQ